MKQKRADASYWEANGSFTPLPGEIILYQENDFTTGIKIGDGINQLSALPYFPTATSIRDLLASLSGNNRLDYTAIKGLENVVGGGAGRVIQNITTNYTLADNVDEVRYYGSGTITVTIPDNLSLRKDVTFKILQPNARILFDWHGNITDVFGNTPPNSFTAPADRTGLLILHRTDTLDQYALSDPDALTTVTTGGSIASRIILDLRSSSTSPGNYTPVNVDSPNSPTEAKNFITGNPSGITWRLAAPRRISPVKVDFKSDTEGYNGLIGSYDLAVIRSSWSNFYEDPMTLIVAGLDIAKTYRVQVCTATSSADLSLLTTIDIYEAQGNQSQTRDPYVLPGLIDFTGIEPNIGGQIEIDWRKVAGQQTSIINFIDITEEP